MHIATLALMKKRGDKTVHAPVPRGGFLSELSDLIRRRRILIVVIFAFTVLAVATTAVFLPELIALDAQRGAITGTAGLILGVIAAAVADATDTKIYGSRHVRGTGGELAAVIGAQPVTHDVAAVLRVLDRIRHDRIDVDAVLRVGVADASPTNRHAQIWAAALAEASANRGERVLEVALAGDATNSLGVCDVVRDNVPLSTAAQRVSTGTAHARLNPGPNRVQALEMLAELTATLPRNLDTYIVGLPLAASRPVVAAVARLDVVLVVAEYATSTRVELIAGLDAIEAVGVMTQVLLVQPHAVTSQPPVLPDATAKTALPAEMGNEPEPVTSQSVPAPSIVHQPAELPVEPDPDATQRIAQAKPLLDRTHNDADHTLLQSTAQIDRYVNRNEGSDDNQPLQR